MYVNHAEDTKPHLIFLSWPGGLRILRWGLCGAVNRRGYSSTQGSKISKPEGFWEDGEGGCSGRVSGRQGLAFVPTPPPGSPEKRLICHGPELCGLIGRDGRADVGAAAGGSDESSTSLSHGGMVLQHRPSGGPPAHGTRRSLARVALKDGDTLGNDEHKCFPQNDVCFGNVLWVLTDRTWIHLKILLTN